MGSLSKVQQIIAALMMAASIPACIGQSDKGFWLFAIGFVWLVVVRAVDWLGEKPAKSD